MTDFWNSIVAWIESTKIQQQIKDVDYMGLVSNPWFMVPFVALVLYLLYRQAFRDLIIISLFIIVWWVTGLDYMQTIIVGGELQINKILPVLFGGAAVLGLVVYLLFGRSD